MFEAVKGEIKDPLFKNVYGWKMIYLNSTRYGCMALWSQHTGNSCRRICFKGILDYTPSLRPALAKWNPDPNTETKIEEGNGGDDKNR